MNVKHTCYDVLNATLKSFVDNYFIFEFTSDSTNSLTFKVPPTGFPTLLFCYGNKVNFFQHKHLSNESIVVGQLSKHINLHPVNGTKILGVNFKPYGFYNLTGYTLKSLRNSATESTAFFPENKIEEIETFLQESNDIEKTVELIESMLLNQSISILKNDYLDKIVDEIVRMNGLLDPFSLTEGKISTRSFQRYFSEVIGISPKVFCQVLRHKFILQLMYGNPELKWNEMVLGGYYYDYSHFQKDFIKFTDVKPFEYLNFRNPFADKLV